LALRTYLNDELFGQPIASDDMQFDFAQLIAHAAKTRPLSAGTIVGSGTVSNDDVLTGCSCLAEKRVLEIINDGEANTPFLSFGDKVRIEMFSEQNENLFGSIEQSVKQLKVE
jgi:fumarylacetoacetate (FAA) hydrolase